MFHYSFLFLLFKEKLKGTNLQIGLHLVQGIHIAVVGVFTDELNIRTNANQSENYVMLFHYYFHSVYAVTSWRDFSQPWAPTQVFKVHTFTFRGKCFHLTPLGIMFLIIIENQTSARKSVMDPRFLWLRRKSTQPKKRQAIFFAIKKQEDKKGLAQVCPSIRQWKYIGIGLIFNKGFSPL